MTEEDIRKEHQSRVQFVIGVVVFLAVIVGATLLIISSVTSDNLPQDTIEDSTTVDISESTPEETNSSIPEDPDDIPEETEDTACDDKVADEEKNEVIEPEIDQDELELLACVIYQEAGGDYCCDECRRRVADVVLNRVDSEHFPDTIYEVLTQQDQYGRYHWTGVVWPSRSSSDAEANAVARAYKIAEEVLSGQHSELYGNGYIWQAEFPQGSDKVYCCGIYFGK